MRYANDGLRFLLELAMLGSLAYWGVSQYGGALQWLLGLGAPLVVAAIWGTFMSPKASHPVDDPLRLGLEIVVFGSGAVALLAADRTALALALAALTALHLALTFPLRQRPPSPTAP